MGPKTSENRVVDLYVFRCIMPLYLMCDIYVPLLSWDSMWTSPGLNFKHSSIISISHYSGMSEYVKLEVYVPVTHAQAVKAAMAATGAGRLGAYDSCMWSTPGTGQFRPLAGSSPFLGHEGQVEEVEEVKIECIVEKPLIKQVITALKASHPYEVPALQYWPVFLE